MVLNLVKIISYSLRFLLEILLIASLCYCGFTQYSQPSLQFGLGILLPLMVVIFWTVYIAPKASHRLALAARLICEAIIFFGCLGLIYLSGFEQYALSLVFIAIINSIIINFI